MNKNIFCYIILAFAVSCVVSSCRNEAGDSALETYEKGMHLAKKENKLNEGCQELLHSLSLQNENEPTELLAKTYLILSWVYWQQDYTDKALNYGLKAYNIPEKVVNKKLRLNIINRVASCYYLRQNSDSTYYYYNELLEKAEAMNDSTMMFNAYNNIGATKISDSKFREAMQCFHNARKYSKKRDSDESTYHYNLSRCYENLQLWDSCVVEIRKCLDYTPESDIEARSKLQRRLYFAEKNIGNTQEACDAAGISFELSDKVFAERQREELKNITEKYQEEKYQQEIKLQRTHWMNIVLFIIVLAVIAVFATIVTMVYRNKKRMEKLQQRIENLNLQVIREEQERDNKEENQWTEEKEENLSQLYLEQFKVSRDIFMTRPAANKIKQLKYHTDKNYLPDAERMPLIDSVLEVFIDQLQKLRVNYPELTEDECLYAVLIFVGCNNATASMLTKTTEATLRKRRSRFKQKTTERVFNLLLEN